MTISLTTNFLKFQYILRLDQRLQSFVFVFHNPPLNRLGLIPMENLARGIQFYVSSLGGSVSARSTEPHCIVFQDLFYEFLLNECF